MAKRKTTPATKATGPVYTIREALDKAEPRPVETDDPTQKKNYAERLSRHLATCLANALRKYFKMILPTEDGGGQESKSRSRRSLKKLDINYSTVEMGLGLGVSIKTINFRDYSKKKQTFGRFTKNYSRNDNELRAEATDYHLRQPYAVLVAVVFLPVESCDDGGRGKDANNPSSFAEAVNYFRLRANRTSPMDDVELFERVFIGIYHHDGKERGNATFYDVMEHKPPRHRRPRLDEGIDFPTIIERIRAAYDDRNNPAPVYADD